MDLNIKEKLDSMTVFELRHLAGEQGFLNPSGKKRLS